MYIRSTKENVDNVKKANKSIFCVVKVGNPCTWNFICHREAFLLSVS